MAVGASSAATVLHAQQAAASAITAEQLWSHAIRFLIGQMIVGALVLVAWVAISKRFLDREFPAAMTRLSESQSRMETRIATMDTSVRAIERDLTALGAGLSAVRDTQELSRQNIADRVARLERKVFPD